MCIESKQVTFIVPKYYEEEDGLITRGSMKRNASSGILDDSNFKCDKHFYMNGEDIICIDGCPKEYPY